MPTLGWFRWGEDDGVSLSQRSCRAYFVDRTRAFVQSSSVIDRHICFLSGILTQATCVIMPSRCVYFESNYAMTTYDVHVGRMFHIAKFINVCLRAPSSWEFLNHTQRLRITMHLSHCQISFVNIPCDCKHQEPHINSFICFLSHAHSIIKFARTNCFQVVSCVFNFQSPVNLITMTTNMTML